jgi:tetratricopeptide (TPR) repeat protein
MARLHRGFTLLLPLLWAAAAPRAAAPDGPPASTAGSVVAPSPEAARHVTRGKELHDAFDYAEAAREFEEAHRLAPDGFEALEWLCHVYNDLGHGASGSEAEAFYRKAADYAEALRRGHPHRAEGYFWVAAGYGNLALFKGGRDKVRLARDVEENAKKAIALDPDYAPPYVALGIFYREVAELSWVLRAFAKMLYGGLPKGTREDSEEMLRRAVELDPTDVLARYQLGLTLLSRDRDEDAAGEFRAVLALPVAEAEDRKDQADARARLERLERK